MRFADSKSSPQSKRRKSNFHKRQSILLLKHLNKVNWENIWLINLTAPSPFVVCTALRFVISSVSCSENKQTWNDWANLNLIIFIPPSWPGSFACIEIKEEFFAIDALCAERQNIELNIYLSSGLEILPRSLMKIIFLFFLSRILLSS